MSAVGAANLSRSTTGANKGKRTSLWGRHRNVRAENMAMVDKTCAWCGQPDEEVGEHATSVDCVDALKEALSSCQSKLNQLTWHRVSDGRPTEMGRQYVLYSPSWGGVVATYDGTNFMHEAMFWLGPLPEPPK